MRRDILQVSTREILQCAGLAQGQRPDLLMGGPPCTPFSKSGFWLEYKRAGLDPGTSLLQAYTRVLAEAKPRAFILENVYALTYNNKASRPAYERLLREIRDAGYIFSPKVLNAADYGVPQLRPRLFIVGVPRGCQLPERPEASHTGCGNARSRAQALRRTSRPAKPWTAWSASLNQVKSSAGSTPTSSRRSRPGRTTSTSPPNAATPSPCSSGAAATGHFS
ncbi:MAG: DNA cytosine methyltransferase [Streptosporangiaceae bacterium]